MKWTDIRNQLKDAPKEVLLDLLKGLYSLSSQNKAFLRAALSPDKADPELLEKSRRQVIRAIYPENRIAPAMPHFGDSRKVIRAYQKTTGDETGTLDLMLLHVERGTDFTLDFGDIDDQFYSALENMLSNAVDLLAHSRDAARLYDLFKQRIIRLGKKAARIGWGYGDNVSDTIDELHAQFSQ